MCCCGAMVVDGSLPQLAVGEARAACVLLKDSEQLDEFAAEELIFCGM